MDNYVISPSKIYRNSKQGMLFLLEREIHKTLTQPKEFQNKAYSQYKLVALASNVELGQYEEFL